MDADGPPLASSFFGAPIETFPDGCSIESHSGGSCNSTDSALVIKIASNGITYMFHRHTITDQYDRIARLTSEDEAQADRLLFEADIKALIQNSPPSPTPIQLKHTASLHYSVVPPSMPHVHETSSLAIPVGQYYPAPPGDTATIAYDPQSHLFSDATMSPVPQCISYEYPFLSPPKTFSHCSKFKSDLESSVKLKNDTIFPL
jgi:hypothetical protein